MRGSLNPVVLEVVRGGQDDVAVLAGLRELRVVGDDARNLRQDLVDALCLSSVAADRVRADVVEQTNRELLAQELARVENFLKFSHGSSLLMRDRPSGTRGRPC